MTIDYASLKQKIPKGPWSVDPDDRDGMEWNNHIIDANGNRVCFMANSGNADNSAYEAAAEAIAHVHSMLDDLTAPVTGEIGELIERLKKAELLGWIRTMEEAAAALQRLAQENAWLKDAHRVHASVGKAREERIRELEADLKQHQELNVAEHEFLLLTTAERDAMIDMVKIAQGEAAEAEAERDAARSDNTEMREVLAELNEAFVNPGDGGPFETGEMPPLDRARAILSKTEPKDQSNANQ